MRVISEPRPASIQKRVHTAPTRLFAARVDMYIYYPDRDPFAKVYLNWLYYDDRIMGYSGMPWVSDSGPSSNMRSGGGKVRRVSTRRAWGSRFIPEERYSTTPAPFTLPAISTGMTKVRHHTRKQIKVKQNISIT